MLEEGSEGKALVFLCQLPSPQPPRRGPGPRLWRI